MNEFDPELRIDVPGGTRPEDEPDLEGYDDSQRAEITEVETGGPADATIMTDLDPDLNDGGPADDEDDLDDGEMDEDDLDDEDLDDDDLDDDDAEEVEDDDDERGPIVAG